MTPCGSEWSAPEFENPVGDTAGPTGSFFVWQCDVTVKTPIAKFDAVDPLLAGATKCAVFRSIALASGVLRSLHVVALPRRHSPQQPIAEARRQLRNREQ